MSVFDRSLVEALLLVLEVVRAGDARRELEFDNSRHVSTESELAFDVRTRKFCTERSVSVEVP